jgi:hypothetical protein
VTIAVNVADAARTPMPVGMVMVTRAIVTLPTVDPLATRHVTSGGPLVRLSLSGAGAPV